MHATPSTLPRTPGRDGWGNAEHFQRSREGDQTKVPQDGEVRAGERALTMNRLVVGDICPVGGLVSLLDSVVAPNCDSIDGI